MPDPQNKLVKVPNLGVVSFPPHMDDDSILKVIRKHKGKTHETSPSKQPLTNESLEHVRQMKEGKPLSSAIPDWANTPLAPKVVAGVEAAKRFAAGPKAYDAQAAKDEKTKEALSKEHPVQAGIGEGIKEFGTSMSTPVNLGMMAAMPESKALSALFAIQGLNGAYTSEEEARKAYQQGNNQLAAKFATQAVLGGAAALAAGGHALPESIKANLGEAAQHAVSSPHPEAGFLKFTGADKDEPFFLKSERLIGEKMKGPMPAADLQKMLLSNGVKPEEMKWNGMEDFLWQNWDKKITPQQMQEHIANNGIELKEVERGGVRHGKELNNVQEIRNAPDQQKPIYGLRRSDGILATERSTGLNPRELATFLELHKDDYSIHEGPLPKAPETKYGSYVLPGATNYREMLVTMPDTRTAQYGPRITELPEGYKAVQNPDMPSTPEWGELGQPRQSWHIETPEGKKIGRGDSKEDAIRFALEDINYERRRAAEQKMNQDKTSFHSSHWDEPNILGHVRFNDRTGPNGEKILHLEELQSDWHQKGRGQGYGSTRELEGVPDAPFKKDWHELLLKRMMRYASQNGYDGISWTPGAAQAERYSLSKKVSKLSYSPHNNMLRGFDHDGDQIVREIVPQEKLPDFIGKEAAKKLLETPTIDGRSAYEIHNDKPEEPTHVLEGEALDVGGQGMKGFYDKIIPDAVNKLAKPWGGKVEKTSVKTADATDSKKLWRSISQDGRLGQMPLYAIFNHGEWVGTTGLPEPQSAGDTFVKVAEEDGTLIKNAKLPESTASRTSVHYLPITPEMRKGITSQVHSLFGSGTARPLEELKKEAAIRNPNAVKVVAPDGSSHYFPNEESAAKFKREVGIQ